MFVNSRIIYRKAQLRIISFLSFWKLFSEIWKKTTKPRIVTIPITLTTEGTTDPYPFTFPPGFEDENH